MNVCFVAHKTLKKNPEMPPPKKLHQNGADRELYL